MTAIDKTITGAPPAIVKAWKDIKWKHVNTHVKRLQMRIYKAV